jgi:hypothetical protein
MSTVIGEPGRRVSATGLPEPPTRRRMGIHGAPTAYSENGRTLGLFRAV